MVPAEQFCSSSYCFKSPLSNKGSAFKKSSWIEYHANFYATNEIARQLGHTVLKTPPYHCELQSIEGVWSMVKEPVAQNPIIGETPGSWITLTINSQKRWLIFVWKKKLKTARQYVIADAEHLVTERKSSLRASVLPSQLEFQKMWHRRQSTTSFIQRRALNINL